MVSGWSSNLIALRAMLGGVGFNSACQYFQYLLGGEERQLELVLWESRLPQR